jgi:hypothetical protein
MRAVAIICFIVAGIQLGGGVVLIGNEGTGDIVYTTGVMLPAVIFLFLGLVFNHLATKKLKAPSK